MAVLISGVRSNGADREIQIDLSSKVTLIYAQTGSAKSTISSYFSDYYAPKYFECRFECQDELFKLVFKQDYLERKFSPAVKYFKHLS
ncbi:hypothetical protein [Erwinia billingiae]|uniref:hypothetical protein n=1 Tax=Erwinia billingiae TaxID=182337 RepID=UPI003209D846